MLVALVLIGIAFFIAGLYVVVGSRFSPNRREAALRAGLAFSTACIAAAAIALVVAQLAEPRSTRLAMLASCFIIVGAIVGIAVSAGRRSAKSH
jgi:hypothetical protein